MRFKVSPNGIHFLEGKVSAMMSENWILVKVVVRTPWRVGRSMGWGWRFPVYLGCGTPYK